MIQRRLLKDSECKIALILLRSVGFRHWKLLSLLSGPEARLMVLITSCTTNSDTTSSASAARGKTAAIAFVNAESGEGCITVEGNVGDRYACNI
jgi:hypothetical protein